MHVSKEKIAHNEVILHLSGQMTFVDASVFQHVVDVFNTSGIEKVVLDVSALKFIDSAGLGMFFIAREEAEEKGVKLVLQGAKEQVKKMFTISCFYDVFDIR